MGIAPCISIKPFFDKCPGPKLLSKSQHYFVILNEIFCDRMNTQAGFVLKIFLISTVLAILIKYGGRYVPVQPTTTVAASAVFLPSLVIGFVLGWQYLNN